jgi:diguanylate cyclase (GGDEF)-like protein
MHTADRSEYSALSDRMTALLMVRLAMAGIVAGWALLRPEVLGIGLVPLLAVSGGYVAVAFTGEWARRTSNRRGLPLITVMLLIDGLYLAWAMYVTGGTQSPLRFLLYLHLVAVSLLASYRTGLKLALWDSLLLLVVLYAQAAQLVPAVDVIGGTAIEFERMPLLNVTSFWLFALATSVFSAMNERELRHRRADLQTIVDIGARLDDMSDPIRQSVTVLDGLAGRFGFQRGLVIGASDDQMIILSAIGVDDVPTMAFRPDAIVARAWERREILAVRELEPALDPILAEAMPGARNVLIAPMIADGRAVGAIVVEHPSAAIRGVDRRLLAVLGQTCAIAALNLRNAVLLRDVQDLAERDSLTGAANRRMFQVSLERILATLPSAQQVVSAVLFVDLDDFKVINDTLGHAAGDSLLQAVTERISNSVRDGDLVARLGGDEFAILTDDAPDLKRSLAMADRLTRELRVPYVINDHTISVTASIGIASARDATDTAEEIVRNADVAMYMAKANGKAGFAVFDPGMHAAMRDRHELGTQLQHAVELGQLRLVYQPIVDLRDGSLAGVEALVRWQHPERGLVTPGEFIEIAEENGAILPIGKWVLREACREANTWAGMAPETFLCVNVSAREIQQPGFVDAVQEALADAGMSAARLSLEITETALLRATPSTVATLESLRDLGVRVVIDDFGTGYFSLSHLRQFPVDLIKIASEFVQVPDTDSKTAALAGAIVAMGRSLDIKTVAEGIETAEQAARMRDLGCSYGQGYFFAKPVAAERVGTEVFSVGDLLPAGAPADAQTAAEPGAERSSPRWPFGDPVARRRRRSTEASPA